MRDVRIGKQTISILLAVQFLVSFGLCGGLCCVKIAESSASPSVGQVAESEESLPPCHRKKAEEKQLSQSHSARQTHSEHHTAAGKATASLLNRNCCAQKREAPEGESLPSTAAPQIGKIIAVLAAPPWCDGNFNPASSSVPTPFSASHSPPHTGFQLSLRI